MADSPLSISPTLESPSLATKPTNFRWVICGLLFYATTINYVDRSILNAMAPDLQKIIGWHPYQYGLIGAAFSLAYGIGFIIMGNLIDKVGTRIGYAIALATWTLAALSTVFTRTPFYFGLSRFCLGLGEAGNFPAAIKTVAEWFPQKQRATATGIFNAGSNVGAIIAPILAITLVPFFGWQAAFLVTPILATIWIILWLTLYRAPAESRHANEAERELILSDSPVEVPPAQRFPVVMNTPAASTQAAAVPSTSRPKPVKWRSILPHRQTWAFMVGKFLTDPIWWFYLFWAGAFFHDTFGATLGGLAGPLIYIYILADVGSVAGGWFSSNLIRRGWTPNAARKTAMATCAILILPVIAAPLIPANFPGGLWIAATLIGVAAAAHQGFSANIFTTTSDMFPKRAVSSVVGLGGLAGALGSIIMQTVSGTIKEITGSYIVMFVTAGSVYVLAVVAIHLLAPRLQRVSDEELESTDMPRGVTCLVTGVFGFVLGVPLSFLFQDQALSLAKAVAGTAASLPATVTPFTFTEYLAAIVPPGNIFQAVDKAKLLPALLWTPLGAAVVMVVLGALVHSFLFPPRNRSRVAV